MILETEKGKIEGEEIRVYGREDNSVVFESDSEEKVLAVDGSVPGKKDNGDYPIVITERDGHAEVKINQYGDYVIVGNERELDGTLEAQDGDRIEIGRQASLDLSL